MQLTYSKTVMDVEIGHDIAVVVMEHKDSTVNVHAGHGTNSVVVSTSGKGKPIAFTMVSENGLHIYFDSEYQPMLVWHEYGEGMYVANLGTIAVTVQLNVARPFYTIEDRKKMLLGLTELPELLDEEVTGTPFEDAEYKLLEILGIDYVTANVD